jgi:zinc protease
MRDLGPDLKAASIPGPHDIVRHELDNGIVILVRENHASPSVVIDGLLRAGAVDTRPEKAGLASFAAAALLRGAGGRTFTQIFEEIESVGARLAFSAGQHSTEFSGRCLAEDLDLILDIAWDALRTPGFPAEQLERLRGQILTGLHIQAHDTRQVAGLEFAKLAYQPEHPYSRIATGTIETVSAITREDILSFHRQYYAPRGMILSIVGDVRAETLIPRLEQQLGGWSDQEQAVRPELPPVRPLAATQERFVSVPGKSQADIILGAAGPPRAAEDFMHARLANTILGVFGLMGRLGAKVRDEQGLAYYAYSELRGGLGPGPWLVSAGVHPENVSQVIRGIRDEIRRLQSERVPADELADNQSFMLGSLPIHLETNEGVSNIILDMELFGLGMDYLQRYPEMIRGIEADQVQAAAQKYLNPDVYALAVAGPLAENSHE